MKDAIRTKFSDFIGWSICVALLFLASQPVLASPPDTWSAVGLPVATPYYIHDIWAVTSSEVFAVGAESDRAVVFRFDGSTWNRVYHGSFPSSLFGIWGSSSQDVFAVGPGGLIVHYDGTQWVQQSPPAGTTTLRGVSGTGPADVYAVGESGTVLRYDGAGWSKLPPPSGPGNLEDVWVGGTGCIIAVASYGGGVVNYYNGTVWGTIPAPSDHLTGVWGRSCNDFYVVGAYQDRPGDGVFYQCNQRICQPTTCSVPQTWTVRGLGDHVFSVGYDGSARYVNGPVCTILPVGTSAFLAGVWPVSPCAVYLGGNNAFRYGTCSSCPDGDGDGFSECAGDCDDSNGAVYPGAPEACNGADDNCNRRVDEGFDADLDGWSTCGNDCDDKDARTHPGATEICDNRDNDCDAQMDEVLDRDGDGYTTCQNDCNDADPNIKPLPGGGCGRVNFGLASGSPVTSDPVNVATGNFTQEETDLSLAGPGFDLAFTRTYNSQEVLDGPLGYGWMHSFQVRLNLDGIGTRTAWMEDGHTEIYSPDGAGGFTPPYGLRNSLVQNADGSYNLTRKSDRLRFDFDATGRLIRVVDKNGNSLACNYTGSLISSLSDTAGRRVNLAYDASGRIISLTDSIGRAVTYAYDAAGNLVTVTSLRGFTTTYTYNSSHQLLTVRDGRGNVVVTNVYDALQRVVSSQQDAFGFGTQFAYDWNLNKTDVTDSPNNRTTFYYDAFGRTLRVVDPLGHELSYIYNSHGERVLMTDKSGATTEFTYDAKGNILSRSDPDEALTQFSYDANDRVLMRVDPLGFQEEFTYDTRGNETEWVDRNGSAEARTYTGSGQLATLTDRRGKIAAYTYDSEGNLTQVTDPLGKTTSYEYDEVGRLLAERDPNGNITRFVYEAGENLVEVRNALNQSTVYGYDENDNQVKVTDALGGVTTRVFDKKNRLVEVTDPEGHTTAYAYDANDRKVAEADARNNSTTFQYDEMGNLIGVVDPLDRKTSHTYDAMGRRLSTTDPDGVASTFAYDAMGRLVRTTDALNNVTTVAYDLRGNQREVTDALGRRTTYEYDGEQRLTAIMDALGGRSEFTYDGEGHRLTLSNANRHTTAYEYDDAGRLVRITDPPGNIASFAYDDGGRQISRTDASGRTTMYAYDAEDRLTEIAHPDGSAVIYAYDGLGRRLSMTDSTGTIRFTYDLDGAVLSVTDGRGRTLDYAYDAGHNRTGMTLPGNLVVAYTYDAVDRMASVSDWLGGRADYTYSPAGLLSDVTYSNGTIEQFAYDPAGRLVQQQSLGGVGIITDYRLGLDAVGNRTSIARTQPLFGTLSDLSETYTYDAGERILSRGTATYAHDPQGNLTALNDGTSSDTFTYDFENRMTGVSRGAALDTYLYDGDGARTRASRAGAETRYLLDRTEPLVTAMAEIDASETPVRYHIFGHRLLWSLDAAGNRFMYHADPVGSVVAITDASQAVAAAFDYDEFGAVTAASGPYSTDARFVGSLGVTREPSGLDFMRARHYDPDTGRFISMDPFDTFTFSSSVASPYSYAEADPIDNVDSDGLRRISLRGTGQALSQITRATSGWYASRRSDVSKGLELSKQRLEIWSGQRKAYDPGRIEMAGLEGYRAGKRDLIGAGAKTAAAPLATRAGGELAGSVVIAGDLVAGRPDQRAMSIDLVASTLSAAALRGTGPAGTFLGGLFVKPGLSAAIDWAITLGSAVMYKISPTNGLPAAQILYSDNSPVIVGGTAWNISIPAGPLESNVARFPEQVPSLPGVCVKCSPAGSGL